MQKLIWAPCLDTTEVLSYKVINGGYTWPGSVGTTGVGYTNRDIIASEEIWNFVSLFSLDESSTIQDEPEERAFRLYPNPANNAEILLTEGIPPGILVCLRIWSIVGSLVSEMQLPGGEGKTISMKGLSPGFYLVNIQYGYSVENTKLIIL